MAHALHGAGAGAGAGQGQGTGWAQQKTIVPCP